MAALPDGANLLFLIVEAKAQKAPVAAVLVYLGEEFARGWAGGLLQRGEGR